jgi:AP-3 complex subunit delta
MTQRLGAEQNYQGVVSATVNALCELALRNPTDYLPLAPQLFHILTTSANNWMLIKIVKLVCELLPSLLQALTIA